MCQTGTLNVTSYPFMVCVKIVPELFSENRRENLGLWWCVLVRTRSDDLLLSSTPCLYTTRSTHDNPVGRKLSVCIFTTKEPDRSVSFRRSIGVSRRFCRVCSLRIDWMS